MNIPKFKYDIYIDQGASYTETLTPLLENGDPVDLTSCTGKSQIRKSYYSSNSITLSVNVVSNTIILSLNANSTSAAHDGRYFYDVFITNSNNYTYKLYEGIATIIPSVTK